MLCTNKLNHSFSVIEAVVICHKNRPTAIFGNIGCSAAAKCRKVQYLRRNLFPEGNRTYHIPKRSLKSELSEIIILHAALWYKDKENGFHGNRLTKKK